MVLAAPEFVIAELIELIDKSEVAAELQHRMLADRVMRGEEGSELQARHGGFLQNFFVISSPKVRAGRAQGNRASKARNAWSPDETCIMPPRGTGPNALTQFS